ncbi:glycosyltransferase family A protein [Zhongshania borealis]|uniref:O antigen biosynthesis rhamnosyltransferase RfbN n=1 Tax=Zhongshania borealis TaxID=889488 RepID=A0ABP7WL37_9GAMM
MNFTVVIPTYNAGPMWQEAILAIKRQTLCPAKVVVIDSSSTDNTAQIALDSGFEVHIIDKANFDHGGTRSSALEFVDTEFVVFLTQDAVLNGVEDISQLLMVFQNELIGAVYGRQLPHFDANPLAKYARENSYGNESYITTLSDEYPKGFRKAFMSNSFAAYRLSVLNDVGGFPSKLILGEDSFVAARILTSGRAVAYVAEACVRHSHNYSVNEEFKRYFDIGVFHSTQSWMLDELGGVEGEGVKFALGQLRYMCSLSKFYYIPVTFFSSIAKYVGYRLGRNYHVFSLAQCRKFSMYKSYWS